MPSSANALEVNPPHIGPIVDEGASRERFGAAELAIVLSYFNIGIIKSIREARLGSRRSPKAIIKSEQGEFLLKRRARGRDDIKRVAFAQGLQRALAERHFPVPAIIRPRGGKVILQIEDRIYELFEFVHGTRYDRSLGGTQHAGFTLGLLHRSLNNFKTDFDPGGASFHKVENIDAYLRRIPMAIHTLQPEIDPAWLKHTCEVLHVSYHDAVSRVDKLGYAQWPRTVLHGDWHPGNLLYREEKVVGVLDFDTARIEQRMGDVANGGLQFSMMMTGPEDPQNWPDGLDAERLKHFVRGYNNGEATPLRDEEKQALPWLMIEALIVESVIPIAMTGRFAHLPGAVFLDTIQRKVRWIRPRADRLTQFLSQ